MAGPKKYMLATNKYPIKKFSGRKFFSAAEGIGAEGFEPPTYCSQSSRASQAALCSDKTWASLNEVLAFFQSL